MSSSIISGDIRPEFYKLSDTVRAGFLKERFAAELEKACAMSAAYMPDLRGHKKRQISPFYHE
jgi:hypothetical protein